MCGLSGFTGFEKANPYALRVLLIDNEARGTHATGLGNLEGIIEKWAVEPSLFMMYDEFNKVSSSKTVIAHNRYATMTNRADDKAAHPFSFAKGRIIGAHNGFVPEWKTQAKNNKIDASKLTVDSEIFFHHLINNKFNVESLAEIEGACALSWIDTHEGMLWLYRRASRPLYIGELAKKEIYYSSRQDGLNMLGVRGVIELDTDVAYGFKDGELVKMIPVPKAELELPMDCTLSFYDIHLTPDLRKKLGIKEIARRYQPTQRHTGVAGRYYDPWEGIDDDYGYGRHSTVGGYASSGNLSVKKHKINVDDVVGGKLEHLVSLTIDSFDSRYKDLLTTEPYKSNRFEFVNPQSKDAVVVAEVKSSVDLQPISDAIVFVDTFDSKKFLTDSSGVASLRIPENKVGNFIRIAMIPFPYTRMYYTKLLTVNAGEIMEVSLFCPFRLSDRSDLLGAKEKKGKQEGVSKDTKSGHNARSSELPKKAGNPKGSNGNKKGNRGRRNAKSQSKLEQSGGDDTRWGGEWSEYIEADEAPKKQTKGKNSTGTGGKAGLSVGEVSEYGFLTKSVGAQTTTIYDSSYKAILEIDTNLFKTYAFEFNELAALNVDMVSLYTDTSWGYLRFCGNHPYSLIKQCYGNIVGANDYVNIGEIIDEAKRFIN